MTFLKRLRVITAVLGVAAIATATVTHLLGDNRKPAADNSGRPDAARVVEDLAVTKFSTQPALTYQIKGGDLLFAWQIKPTLDPAPARPRDVVVMVDTSASQAGLPLKQARNIVAALGTTLGADDRVSVWTVSTPQATKPLTNGFFPANSDEVKAAAAALTDIEYGSGATDLKTGLSRAAMSIPQNRGRHQMVLFLGDGESAFNPMSEGERVAIGQKLDIDDVYFFAVPLGLKVNPHNLHGLAALTGGSVVRLTDDLANPAKQSEIAHRLKSAFDAPVVKVEKQAFGAEIAEVFPARLPPLRADRATLVMGTMAKLAPAVTLAVTGKVANRPVKLDLSQNLPQSQADHFFMNMMVDQWRAAPHKEAPAILQSDRALALAATQVKLYRDEFLTQALWAATADRFDEATKLYAAAKKIDPNDPEAAAGLAVMEQFKSGKITKADILKQIAAKDPKAAAAISANAQANGGTPTATQPPKVDPAGQPPKIDTGTPQAAGDLLTDARNRRRIEEERYRVIVDATLRDARQQLRSDPDGAYQNLKRQRDDIRGYDGLGEGVRTQLVANLESVMREVFVKGAEVKRQAAVEREQIARTRQRLNEFDRQQSDEDRVKSRIDAFKQLMQQARFELAYQEAQLMVQERIAQGRDVPAAAVAGYTIGQHATQLREWRELVRIREDRFLLTMMQSEKSHIPYPDEPPVHFPPATVWRELTGLRRDKYTNTNVGNEPTKSQIELQDKLESRGEWQEKRVTMPDKLTGKRIGDVLKDLSRQYKGIAFLPMYELLKNDGIDQFDEKTINMGDSVLDGLVLGTFLDIVLQSLGCTYIVRPEYIEITTFNVRKQEKVTRAFPVADLVIPIPSSVNQQTLQQNLSIQNQTLAIFGIASGSTINGAAGGNFGFGGNFGGNIGGGFPGGGAAQFGAMGGQAGGLFPMGGGGQAMGQNQGFGGGFGGFGGGQLGQFGNLGGQFGIQGGDQSSLLIEMIHQTVARGEWLRLQGQQPIPLPGQGGAPDEPQPELGVNELNTVGYYPPARALIIRGTSRYHSGATIKLKKPGDPMAAAPKPNNGNGLAQANPAPNGVGGNGNGNGVAAAKPGLVNPKDAKALAAKLDKDPKRAWSQAIDWTVTDPGLIVATAEFLMDFAEYGHAAEVLKGNLRKGLATDAWAHEALAISLQMSQGSPVEIERAAVSAIDLDPTDPKAYLKAAKVAHDQKNHDLAVAFCKKAAEFGPDQPRAYANALVYAEASKDVQSDSVEWAVGNLLKRDWSSADGIDYHQQAKDRLGSIVAKMTATGAKADTLKKMQAEQTTRDLVIELLWSGSADLDMKVEEPSGSVCSSTHKRTTGGGVLACDALNQTDDTRSETYTAALAFGGTYKVTVKPAFGKPVSNSAKIKVTRFKGTANESHDLIDVDLAGTTPVEVKVDGGNRKELAVVTEDVNELRTEPAQAVGTNGPSGLSGGVGTAGASMTAPLTGSGRAALPAVVPSAEARLPGMGSTADLRMDMKMNPDRQTMTVKVRPVFATTGNAVTLPKVSMMPGGEGGR